MQKQPESFFVNPEILKDEALNALSDAEWVRGYREAADGAQNAFSKYVQPDFIYLKNNGNSGN